MPEGQTEIRREIEKSVERHTLTSAVVLFSSSALGLLARMPEYAVSMAASGACQQQCYNIVSGGSGSGGGGGGCQSSAVVDEQQPRLSGVQSEVTGVYNHDDINKSLN